MAGTSYQIFGDASNLLTELKKSEKAFTDLNKTAERSGQGIDDVMNKLEGLASIAGVSFGAAGMAALAKKVADVRGEFQQLEIAFGTMLGSTDKANKLMIQLTNTAAKTPFDLQGIAQGAKQLIAYGVAAEEINSTIVGLGDVAAGLSLPLNDLVYLYGTTMVQGKMFTNDLKQLQGRGVPILDALADQLGIAKNEVSEYVSAGRVSADVFKAAMLSMSQEGGKFAGLMAAQSASITGQISNIQDGIAMMFNEIGQQSEGAINGILSGVSALVENYEVVGKSIVALAGTYGMYKAALVVVAALENARNLQAKFVVVNNGKQIGLMKLLTAATWKQVKAQLASNAAMLANPAVLVTAGIVALVGAIVGLNKLISISADEMGRANKQHQKRIEKIDEEKNKAYELIGVIEDETSSYYELAAARGELNELEAFKGMNVKSMTGEQIRARIKEWEELEIAAANAKKKEDAINIVGSARQKYVQADGTLQNEDKVLESAKNARKLLIDEEVGNLPVEYDARIKYIQDRIKEEEELLKQSNEKLAELESSWWDRATGKAISGQQRDDLMAGATYDQEMSSFALTQWKSVLENTTGQKLEDDNKIAEDSKGESLVKVVAQIKKQEQEVYKARKAYSDKNSALNKTNLEKEESNLKTLTDKYQLATGESWKDTKKMEEEITKAKQSAANERAKIDISAIRNERMRRAAEYDQQIKEIEQEEEAYKKSHNGRTSGEFNVKRENARIQYDLDIKEIDREFNDWIDSIQRDVVEIRTSMDNSELERAIDLATSYEEKIKKQNELFEAQKKQRKEELDLEEQKTAEDKFGKDTIERYNQYKSGDYAPASEAEKATFENIEEFYDLFLQKRQAVMQQMDQENSFATLDQELQHYEEYVQGMLDAETAYQEELARIREENGLSADADIENSNNAVIQSQVQKAKDQREASQDIVKRDTGLTDDKWVTELGNLGASVAGKAYEEIKKLYDEFINTVNDDIAEVEAQKVAAEKIADGGDAKALKADAQEQLSGVETQLLDPNLSEQKKNELLQQQLELKAQIAYYDAVEQGNAATLNDLTARGAQLVNVRAQAEANASTAQQKALTKEQLQQIKANRQKEVAIQGLETVRDTANAVANTFGGALSNKAKKALDTISQVADFGIDAVKGVESIVNGVSKGMDETSTAAASSMSTVEKASVILTVISIAVQLIMKIVEIASQFTQSAQLQESIDKHLEKVEDLKHKNEQLQRAYKSKTGIDYYKGMTVAAKDLSKVMREQEAALKDAQALYDLQASKYGEDSDKAKEAKEQMNDIQDQYNETADQQAEQLAEVANELGTTDLSSFSQSLAESIVEGFANGMEGVDDVFDQSMDDLYRSMMTKQLAMALEKQFEGVFEALNKKANDGDALTQSEIDELMTMMDQAEEGAQSIAEAYYNLFNERGLLEDADAEGSQGFGQMTQDQADTLTARFTALQIEGANMSAAMQQVAVITSEAATDLKLAATNTQALLYNSNISVQIAQEQLEQLEAIAGNTAMLAETNNRLKSIEQHTSKL